MKTKRKVFIFMHSNENTVVVSARFFEHLLACLANQKFIHDVNADGLADGIDEVRRQQREMQQAIDTAYREGWELLKRQLPPENPQAESGKEIQAPTESPKGDPTVLSAQPLPILLVNEEKARPREIIPPAGTYDSSRKLQAALEGKRETCIVDGCQNPVAHHCSGMLCDAPLCEEHAAADFVPAQPNYYCATCWEGWKKSLQDGKMGEAGALYAFMGWLTSRDAVSGPFSATHEASSAAELVNEYCQAQGWEITDAHWHRHIKPFQEAEESFIADGSTSQFKLARKQMRGVFSIKVNGDEQTKSIVGGVLNDKIDSQCLIDFSSASIQFPTNLPKGDIVSVKYFHDEARQRDESPVPQEGMGGSRNTGELSATPLTQIIIQIIVNGREKVVVGEELSFGQIVRLAYDPVPTIADFRPTVTFHHGPQSNPEGSVLMGERVRIKDGMIFSVTQTNRA